MCNRNISHLSFLLVTITFLFTFSCQRGILVSEKFDFTPGKPIKLSPEAQAIQSFDQNYAKVLQLKDADALMNLIADDAIILTSKPGAFNVVGKDSIRKLNKEFFESTPNLEVKSSPTRIEYAGNLAYVIGEYELTFDDSKLGRMVDRGKYQFVLRKMADKWLIISHSGVASTWIRAEEIDTTKTWPPFQHRPSVPLRQETTDKKKDN